MSKFVFSAKAWAILGAIFAAVALSPAHAQAPFTEFSVGAGFPTKIETIDFTTTADFSLNDPPLVINPGDTLEAQLSGDYAAGLAAGVEIGLRGVGDKHIALSFSYDYMNANLKSITGSLAVNGVPHTETVTLDDIGLTKSDFNRKVNLVLGNIRYDFVGPREPVQPFIAIGGGGAFIEDSSGAAAMAGTAGVKFPLGLGFYAGAKYRYVKIFGYEDQLGIEYDDITGHVISFMLGAQL